MVKRIIRNKNKFLLLFLAVIISITSFAFTYGVVRTFGDENTVSQGVSGNTVYLNDFERDYYYYTGQNYTYSSNMTTPTLEDKSVYGDSNLVEVTLNYNGTDLENKYTGYVSHVSDERQNKFVYYKIFPVENGYINIELIDNPFSFHPNDLMFNGWITNYAGATMSYDSVYYKRYLRVPVTFTNGVPDDIEINLYARWTKGKKAVVNSSTSFSTASSSLEDGVMHQIVLDTNLYQDPDLTGYYRGETLTTTSVVTGSWYNHNVSTTYGECTDCYESNNTYHATYRCPAPDTTWYGSGTYTNTCNVYYLLTSTDVYDPNETYYQYRNNRMNVVTLSPTIVGTKEDDLFDSQMNMAGYFFRETKSRGNSIAGYYSDSGVLQSGNCSSSSCTVYKMIQYYDENNNPSLYDSTKTYYYLTTRDTNIVVMTGNMSSTWSSSFTKPFTLTGLYNGHYYSPVWDVSDIYPIAHTNLRIENLTISSGVNNALNAPSSSTTADATFYGNYFNVKLGRNLLRSGTNVTFDSVQGGMNVTRNNATVGSSGSPKKYHLEIESGFYNSTTATLGATTASNRAATFYGELYNTFGNDYDRARDYNNKLDVYYSTAASWSGNYHSSNDTYNPIVTTTVKSGYFGSSHDSLSTGLYVGARYAGTHYAPRVFKMDGGAIFNLVGAPCTDQSRASLTAAHIYICGGSVDLVTGGAGTTTTYGNRILQITGGMINYGVIGGSNGSDGTSNDGTLTGDTYVYIGGTAVIGNDQYVNSTGNDKDMYGVLAGTVFGAGNGNSSLQNVESIGSVKNSNVVINDSAVIKRDVYGSGNYGTVGYSASNSCATNIKLVGGTINGSVYGSGNNSSSGRDGTGNTAVSATVAITLDGSTVHGGIYGGSNAKGKVYGTTTLNIKNGSVTDVFGGGYGANTYVRGSVLVNIGDATTTNLNVTGDVYGGSALGTVNSTSVTNTLSSATTTVNINNGLINNVYGGGKGDTSDSPCVAGNIAVNVNGGSTTNVFGGNNANGTPVGSVTVNVNGGSVGTVYGGNNSGGTVTATNVQMLGGSVGKIYGGGKQASTGNTVVRVNGGTTGTVFGGGESANVTTLASVNIQSGTISQEVFGGSDQNGTVTQTSVIVDSSVPTVYGGNNNGGTVTTSGVSLNNGTVGYAYGGGKKAAVTTSVITLNGSSVTEIYGGGYEAGVGSTTVNLTNGSSTYVFGGSNSNGTVSATHVNATNPTNLSVSYVYGGNNAGGKTTNAIINITGGTYVDMYGGGKDVETDYTTVTVNGITISDNFFGGGHGEDATVNFSTNVQFTSSNISGDLFGGGNSGEVLGNTIVKVSHSNVGGSVYAGGNGESAIVYGNTNLYVENASVIGSHVFGGGNAANTGTEETSNSISNVNIAGATIHGNVYGGANTAVLYGTSNVKVGYNQTDYIQTDIQIDGTVFGGGEANASGSPNYDFNFIGVTEGINVYIDGGDYNNLNIDGSIFGSGNASSTSGTSKIYIYNYGTFSNYKENISIQRTDLLTIKNSAIRLEGAQDRTNEFSTVKFSLSRIDKLILANDSTLFLDTGANLLKAFYSEKITGNTHEKASVTIHDDGSNTKTVDNRVYMLQGRNLNVATNENATAYGEVSGMTFFGMYNLDINGRVMTALYDQIYDNDDVPASGVLYAFTSGSYVMGEHHSSHNIKIDGFYSNYPHVVEGSQAKIRVKYIEPTPPEGAFYRWVIGEQVTTYEITIAASKYATMGTYELPLVSSADPNTTFNLLAFNYQNLEQGFQLVDPDNIPRVNTSGTADTVMGLAFEPANTGFINSGTTTLMTNNVEPIGGAKTYTSENSAAVPTFMFYLYHSKNITRAREIGTVIIALEVVTPVDELNVVSNRVNINVTLTSALFNNNDYEGSMTSGEKYDLFAPSATNINTKSTLSAYYSLFMMSENSYYRANYNHALVSNFVFPENTKITMLDLVDNQRYYYVVDSSSVAAATSEYQLNQECSYALSNFIKMGSTSTNNRFDESANASKYYDSDVGIVQEEFIFIINFEDTNITSNQLGNTLIMELRNGTNTIISVLGIQRASLTYNLYHNSDAIVDISGNLNRNPVYKGDIVTFNLTGNFTQPVVGTLPVIDTRHFNRKPGVKITVLDSNGNQLNNSSLLGLVYTMDEHSYYPRMDGSVRIALTDKVANIFKRIKLDTTNLSMRSGNYTLKFESFTSPDGIYYGSTSQDTLLVPFTFINSSYGLKLRLTDNETIIDKTAGYTLNNNNILNFKLDYNSTFTDPNIRVALYRRRYDSYDSYDYDKVNLASYVTNGLTAISGAEYEYEFIDTPVDGMSKSLYLRSTIVSGTYKFVFSLYDGDVFIGDCMQYVIIK